MRQLIINADDLALSDGVCDGITQAWHAGAVTSSSALINIEGAVERVEAARRSAPGLPIGLHINLTIGRPVLSPERVPTLVDANGSFHSLAAILQQLPVIDPGHVRLELWAQAQLLQGCGVRFDHIDFHHHLPVFYAPFFAIACELARAYRVPMRRPRPTFIPGARPGFDMRLAAARVAEYLPLGRNPRHVLDLAQQALALIYGRENDQLAAAGIATPARFMVGFGHSSTPEQLSTLLRLLPDGVSELMVHPGTMDPAQLSDEMPPELRAGELAVLLNPEFRRRIDEAGVQLVSYGALRNER